MSMVSDSYSARTPLNPLYTEEEVSMIEREAVLKFARELNEKKVKRVLHCDGFQYNIFHCADFLSVLHNHGIEEKELMK